MLAPCVRERHGADLSVCSLMTQSGLSGAASAKKEFVQLSRAIAILSALSFNTINQVPCLYYWHAGQRTIAA
jgi:hypothetical protein